VQEALAPHRAHRTARTGAAHADPAALAAASRSALASLERQVASLVQGSSLRLLALRDAAQAFRQSALGRCLPAVAAHRLGAVAVLAAALRDLAPRAAADLARASNALASIQACATPRRRSPLATATWSKR
jgi:enoyl-CoA hydratase/carnithine racemase